MAAAVVSLVAEKEGEQGGKRAAVRPLSELPGGRRRRSKWREKSRGKAGFVRRNRREASAEVEPRKWRPRVGEALFVSSAKKSKEDGKKILLFISTSIKKRSHVRGVRSRAPQRVAPVL